MSLCYENSHFNDLSIFLSCCGKNTSLNDLKYDMNCGFARFAINVINPKYPLAKHDLYEASKCFGKLKMIVSKY